MHIAYLIPDLSTGAPCWKSASRICFTELRIYVQIISSKLAQDICTENTPSYTTYVVMSINFLETVYFRKTYAIKVKTDIFSVFCLIFCNSQTLQILENINFFAFVFFADKLLRVHE